MRSRFYSVDMLQLNYSKALSNYSLGHQSRQKLNQCLCPKFFLLHKLAVNDYPESMTHVIINDQVCTTLNSFLHINIIRFYPEYDKSKIHIIIRYIVAYIYTYFKYDKPGL